MDLGIEGRMIAAELLALLRCPESRQPLSPAAPELLARLESDRAAGKLRNRAGNAVTQAIEQGLVREDGRRFYPVMADIPVLIAAEAIDL
jgi:uncharacterized protein YbaR (Trm112 family)